MEDVSTIGGTLRQRREERSLSVQEASAQSKVPLRLLEALESDDYRLLPDPLYLIRFLHDYARFLGLEPGALEEEFQRVVRRPPRVPLGPTATVPTPPVIPWKQLAWTAAAILVVTPLVFIALSLASKRASERVVVPAQPPRGEQAAEAPVQPPTTGENRPPAGGPPVEPESLPAHTAGAALSSLGAAPGPEPAAPRSATSGSGKQVLVAHAQELTWMVIRADGGEPREVLLQAGESARFTADATFLITLGNAGGVSLSVNGVTVPPLGRSGQVVREVTLPQGSSAGEAGAQAPASSGR